MLLSRNRQGHRKTHIRCPAPGKTFTLAASKPVPADKWSRVRVAVDGSTASIYIDDRQVAKNDFPFQPNTVFIGGRPEGNFIACGREKEEFYKGRIDHFRIYRMVHKEFNALGPVPSALTQMQEPPKEEKAAGSSTWDFQQKLKYRTTADWEDRTPEEVEGKAPPKMKDWLMRVRGY